MRIGAAGRVVAATLLLASCTGSDETGSAEAPATAAAVDAMRARLVSEDLARGDAVSLETCPLTALDNLVELLDPLIEAGDAAAGWRVAELSGSPDGDQFGVQCALRRTNVLLGTITLTATPPGGFSAEDWATSFGDGGEVDLSAHAGGDVASTCADLGDPNQSCGAMWADDNLSLRIEVRGDDANANQLRDAIVALVTPAVTALAHI